MLLCLNSFGIAGAASVYRIVHLFHRCCRLYEIHSLAWRILWSFACLCWLLHGFVPDINKYIHFTEANTTHATYQRPYSSRQYINHKISCQRLSFALDLSSASKRLERSAKPLCIWVKIIATTRLHTARPASTRHTHARASFSEARTSGDGRMIVHKVCLVDNSTRCERRARKLGYLDATDEAWSRVLGNLIFVHEHCSLEFLSLVPVSALRLLKMKGIYMRHMGGCDDVVSAIEPKCYGGFRAMATSHILDLNGE